MLRNSFAFLHGTFKRKARARAIGPENPIWRVSFEAPRGTDKTIRIVWRRIFRPRLEDVAPLFTNFIIQLCEKFKEPVKLVAPDVFELLKEHYWPGNVRELRNVAERLILLSAQHILRDHLEQVLPGLGQKSRQNEVSTNTKLNVDEILSLREFKNFSERQHIEAVLERTQGSVTKAAQLLKIDRTYLHQKLTQHGISAKRPK